MTPVDSTIIRQNEQALGISASHACMSTSRSSPDNKEQQQFDSNGGTGYGGGNGIEPMAKISILTAAAFEGQFFCLICSFYL